MEAGLENVAAKSPTTNPENIYLETITVEAGPEDVASPTNNSEITNLETTKTVGGSSRDRLASSLKERLSKARSIHHVGHCLYKVPEWLKDQVSDARAYTPEVVSFGHYHRGNPALTEMETNKWRCLNKMLDRVGLDIRVFVEGMRNILLNVRLCYEVDPIGNGETISEDEFVEMLVLDGCFMLEYLRVSSEGLDYLQYEPDDSVFSKKSKMEVIGRDMIKLENQLPIIVVETLMRVQYVKKSPIELEKDLTRMILNALSPIWVSSEVLTGEKSNEGGEKAVDSISKEMLHCLHIFRSSLLYERPPELTTSSSNAASTTSLNMRKWNHKEEQALLYENSRTRSVEDMRAAGVNFEILERKPFWYINFDKDRGVLEIPPMKINKSSKTIFLNLIAYEQCHFNSSKDMVITDYLAFMDTLVNTAADVSRLYKAGIIVHHQLGNNDEVADIFNNLVKNAYVISEDGLMKDTYTQLDEYCNIERHVWYADLRHNYVKSPWLVISIFAAFILFLLTATQTTYAIIAYHLPPKQH